MGIYKHSTAPIKIDLDATKYDKKFIKDGFQNNEVFTRAYLALHELFGVCEIDYTEYYENDEAPRIIVQYIIPTPTGCNGPDFRFYIRVEKNDADNPDSYEYVIEFKKNFSSIKLYYGRQPRERLRLSGVTPDMMEDIVKTGIKKMWVKRFKDNIQEFEEEQQRRSKEEVQIQLIALEILPEINAILKEYGLSEADKSETDFGRYRIIGTENSSLDIRLDTKTVALETSGYIDNVGEYGDLFIALLSDLEDFSDAKVEKDFSLEEVSKFYETIRKICQTYVLLKPVAELWNARKCKI